MRRTSRAFTLVELLVVITIISMLASLLLPALTKAKYRAGNVACVRTLRQLGGALEMYAMTTDAYLPAVVPLQGQPQSTWYTWNMLLTKLIFPTRNIIPMSDKGAEPPDRSFLCPLLVGRPANLVNPLRPAWDSAYRYNTSGIGPAFSSPLGLGGELAGSLFLPTKQSSVLAPSEMIELGDALTRSPDQSRDGSYEPVTLVFRPQPQLAKSSALLPLDERPFTNYRNHRNRYNRFFCDGHVEFEDCNKPFQDSDSYLARWNVDHLPHRDAWRW